LAAAAAIICRGMTLWLAVIVGLISMFSLSRRLKINIAKI
jgi:uncharacterized membrane protein YbhN (UPF0104 family)